MKWYALMIVFYMHSALACSQVFTNDQGVEIRDQRKLFEIAVNNSSLILWIKAESINEGVVSYSIQKILKGYYPGRILRTDAFPLSSFKVKESDMNEKRFPFPRTQKLPDCKTDISSLGVEIGSSYIFFVGNSSYVLEKADSEKSFYYKQVNNILKK